MLILAREIGITICLAMMSLLLVGVDWRDIGGRLISRWLGYSGLFAMTDEIFEVLYRAHRCGCAALYRALYILYEDVDREAVEMVIRRRVMSSGYGRDNGM